MRRQSLSRSIILGVVPLETSAWKPLMAPHAMVMKTNGKSEPGTTRPKVFSPTVTVFGPMSVSIGMWISGLTTTMPATSMKMVPIFR